ncbi:MAG TPA: hypothetical protein VF522_11840 [Ramlibacter sp.]|uniref:hypothetical protein n=1 Tax=Ramlibacter sp. TaxID=1917967 RepID=UPI002ED515A6
MKIALALALTLAALAPAGAQQDDPLKSEACAAALARLKAAHDAPAAPASVQDLRTAAAGACLGNASAPTRPSRVLQAPTVVPPTQIELPQPVAPLPAPVLPPPPVAIQRPAVPATCDAGGCWTNDGSQLRQLPPGGAGPRGLCFPQGGMVYCP